MMRAEDFLNELRKLLKKSGRCPAAKSEAKFAVELMAAGGADRDVADSKGDTYWRKRIGPVYLEWPLWPTVGEAHPLLREPYDVDKLEAFYRNVIKEADEELQRDVKTRFGVDQSTPWEALARALAEYSLACMRKEGFNGPCTLDLVCAEVESRLSGAKGVEPAAVDGGAEILSFYSLSVGDELEFGRYPQRKSGEPSPILWYVISRDASSILLMSRYGLDAYKFNLEGGGNAWEGSGIQAWLNGGFLSSAFSEAERELIDGEVRIMSELEINLFLWFPGRSGDTHRLDMLVCYATEYAKFKGVVTDIHGTCKWWTRTPSASKDTVRISHYGVGQAHHESVGEYAVRPTIRLKLLGGNP